MDLRFLTDDPGMPEVEISGLAYASSSAEPGSLFFCVPGAVADGHDFAAAAVGRGAVALVCERPVGVGVPEKIVPDARVAMAEIAARFYRRPSDHLDVVGVTGTNGKTTTASLVRQILESCGRRCGMLGTIETIVGGAHAPATRTTPESIDLQRLLRAMADAGDTACAMEVSSHALALSRVHGTRFAVAVLTNVTQDHLDFHGTMDGYFAAKRELFATGPGASVVNLDDAFGRRLAGEFACVTYSAAGDQAADYSAHEIRLSPGGARFACDGPDGRVDLAIRLPGAYNVANALAALASAVALGLPFASAARALSGAEGVRGRFEPVDEGQDFTVIVDYAHTPDSLKNVLAAARALTGNRLIVVFGAGGDRDRDKRSLMGAAAAGVADLVIVTSDNPRSEPPGAIIEQVLSGGSAVAVDSGAEVVSEVDRYAAIALALDHAESGDIVVIAGKGHETGQEFADGRVQPFDDAAVASELLCAARERAGAR